jgi:hypothetical protein
MSYYKVNGKDNFSPPGTVLAYIGSTTIDPPGWIIANGIQRTNGSDGRYNTLIALSVGSGVNNVNYTPPDLDAMFLRGIGSQTYGSINYGGASYKNKIEHNITQHSHTATASEHTHTTDPPTSSASNTGTELNPVYGFGKLTSSGAGNVTTDTATNTDINYPNLEYLWGLTVKSASPGVTVNNNTGNGVSTETRPFNYGVVWIIKL